MKDMEDKIKNFSPELQAMLRLQNKAQSLPELQEQVATLKTVLFRALQEIDALKSALADKEIISRQEFARQCAGTLVADHSSAGPTPWRGHSYFKYLAEEEDYLREIGLTESQLEDFKKSAKHAEQLT